MKLNVQISLSFNGQCEAAFRFYERCLNGTLAFLLTRGAIPRWQARRLRVGMRRSLTPPSESAAPRFSGWTSHPTDTEQPQDFQENVLQMDDPVAAERVFNALAENARIAMPLQETFWAIWFGVLVDQFGIPWSINCEKAVEPTA